MIALAGAIVGTIGGLGDIAASSNPELAKEPELANTVIFTMSCPFWMAPASYGHRGLGSEVSPQHAFLRPAPRPWAPSPRYKRLLLRARRYPLDDPLSWPAGPDLRG